MQPRTQSRERHLVKASRPKLHQKIPDRDLKIVVLPKFFNNFSKNVITTSKLNFFDFLAYFLPGLSFTYLSTQQTGNTLNFRSFTKTLKYSRSQDNSLKTETRKNGSRDRDHVSRPHHCVQQRGPTTFDLYGPFCENVTNCGLLPTK